MDSTVLIAIIAAIETVIVAFFTLIFSRESKRRAKADAELSIRANLRRDESLLTMSMTSAIAGLCKAMAIAIRDKKVNGEMSDALEAVKDQQKDYYEFINRQAAEHISNI